MLGAGVELNFLKLALDNGITLSLFKALSQLGILASRFTNLTLQISVAEFFFS